MAFLSEVQLVRRNADDQFAAERCRAFENAQVADVEQIESAEGDDAHGKSGSGSDVIVAVPRDESRDAGFQRRARSEADGVGQRIDVGKGARYVTRLHRLTITPCLLTEQWHEDFHHAPQLNRTVVSDVVEI